MSTIGHWHGPTNIVRLTDKVEIKISIYEWQVSSGKSWLTDQWPVKIGTYEWQVSRLKNRRGMIDRSVVAHTPVDVIDEFQELGVQFLVVLETLLDMLHQLHQ